MLHGCLFAIVWVCRVDGHMCLANSLALRAANITEGP